MSSAEPRTAFAFLTLHTEEKHMKGSPALVENWANLIIAHALIDTLDFVGHYFGG